MIGVLEHNGPPLSEDIMVKPQLRRAFDRRNDGPLDTKYDLPLLENLRQRSLRSVTDVQSLHSWPPESTPHRPSVQRRTSLNENSLYSMHETQSEEITHRRRSLRSNLFAPLKDMEMRDSHSPPLQRRPSLKESLSKNESSLYSRSITPPPERITPTERLGLEGHLQDMKAPELVPENLPRRPFFQKRLLKSERSLGAPQKGRITPRRRSLDSPLRDMDTPSPTDDDPLNVTPPQRRPSLKKHLIKSERPLSSEYDAQSEIILPRRRSFGSPVTDMKVSSDDDLILTPSRRPSIERGSSGSDSSFRAKYETPPERITPRCRSLRLARPLNAPLKDAEWAKPEHTSTLYRHAKEQAWEEVAVDCKTHKDEARYVYPMDGTTALHLAVMSRVGYSFESEEKAKHPAPLSLVEELLQVYPDAAKVLCQVNTYTPLVYACLVSRAECCLEETDEMVRLFLQYSPESTSVYTSGGLSAVDVHIVSYSRVMTGRTDKRMRLSGRTSTVVLRTLLEHDPKLAHVRVSNDKLGGAIEILYRCNSQAFMKLVADYERKRRQHTRIKTTSETEDNNKRVLARISNWWVWQWTVLILKYGTLPKKKKGARFFALQAASGLVGCPLPILTLTMAAFPNQIKEKDEMHGADGNLPLHEVCSWPQQSASAEPVIATRKGMAITALVQRYPNAVFVCNNRDESPLDLALATGTTWDGGIRKLVRTYPASASTRSSATGLYPFMTAAAVAASAENASDLVLPSSKRSLMTHLKNEAKRDLQTVRTIYGLLRADPDVMLPADEEEESDNDDDSLSAISHENSIDDDDNGFVSSSELDWSGLLSTAQSIREESHRWAQLGDTDASFRQSVRNLNYKPEEDDDMGGYDLKRIGYF